MTSLRRLLKVPAAAALASSMLASFALLGAAPAHAAAAPLPNPNLSEACGLDIGVVLDLSNSLTDEDVANSKSAAKAVAKGLNGTPSRVSVNTFATFGPDGTNSPIPSRSVATSASVESLGAEIDALQRVPRDSGGTNWDRGLGQLDGSNHDLVLFVTDGKPTAYGVPGTDSGNNDRGTRTDQIDIDTAVESANSLKSRGTKVVGLGVGSAINEDNIKLVSGQTENDDYYVVSDYSQLADQLREIATKSCQGTLNVTKLIDPGAGQHGVETDVYRGEGWTISSPDSTDGTEKITNADGTVSFRLKTPTEGVRATEAQQAGYRLQQQSGRNAICTVNGREIGTENIDSGFKLTETVGTDEIVACQLVNEQDPGSLTWKKVDEDGNDLAGAEFTLTGPDGHDFIVSDNGELDVNDADGQFEVTDLAWGDYTIKETAAPDGYVPSEETQTVTINGEGLEKSFVDIVNEKDAAVGVDVEADKDASADPTAERDSSTDAEATSTDDSAATASDDSDESVNASATASASANADDDGNPAAQVAAHAAADEDANNTASAAASENAGAAAESAATEDASSEASTDATTDENASSTAASQAAANADNTDDTNAEASSAADANPAAAASAASTADSSATASENAAADADADPNAAADPDAPTAADEDANNTASAAADENAEAAAESAANEEASSKTSADATDETNASAQQAANADNSDSTNADTTAAADANAGAAASTAATADSSSEAAASAASKADSSSEASATAAAKGAEADAAAAGTGADAVAEGAEANASDSNNGGDLPRTGAGGTLTMIGFAALLIAGGAAAVFASRRYRAQAERP